MLAASLWSAIASYRLIYAVPPASFEQTGQKTRRIKTILNDRLATCLDTSLLFASGLEAMGLNPVLVLTQGHCFVGVWLVKKMFARLFERDCVEIRKAIAAKELIAFETTLVTHHPPARFPDAISTANSALSEGKEREFAAPERVYSFDEEQFRLSLNAATAYGESLSDTEPTVVIPWIQACWDESQVLKTRPTSYTWAHCNAISQKAIHQIPWLAAAWASNVEPHILMPFLFRAIETREEHAEEYLRHCLLSDRYCREAIELVFQSN